jgi:hypothetical protein
MYDALVVRFLTLRTETPDALKGMPDLGRFLTERISIFAQDPKFNFELEDAAFQKTFALLEQALGEDSFRKFNAAKFLHHRERSYFFFASASR